MQVGQGWAAEHCGPPGGLPKSSLRPCLLLLLKEQPGYGYDLVVRLRALGIDDNSATVYRALRTLEDKEAVSSSWHTSATGPARRMYCLTPAGQEQLDAAAEVMAETHRAIERCVWRLALAESGLEEPEPDRVRQDRGRPSEIFVGPDPVCSAVS